MKFSSMISNVIHHPGLFFCILGNRGFLNFLPDSLYLKILYRIRTGYRLNLKAPKGYGEKLQWIKLYLHDPLYPVFVDKLKVRDYVSSVIGDQYLVPLLGVWDKPELINFNELPKRFVLKCNHDSGSVCIVKDKDIACLSDLRRKLSRHLKHGTYWATREWPYKNVSAKIFAEKYLEDEHFELRDYKVLCFNGVPKLIEYHSGRFTNHHTQDFYDCDWNLTTIKQIECDVSNRPVPKPELLHQMLDLSSKLSQNIPHIRVDWYIVDHRLYFSELTLFDSSGFDLFEDPNDERMLGEWIVLPHKMQG